MNLTDIGSGVLLTHIDTDDVIEDCRTNSLICFAGDRQAGSRKPADPDQAWRLPPGAVVHR